MREGQLTWVRNPSGALVERIARLQRHHAVATGDGPGPRPAPLGAWPSARRAAWRPLRLPGRSRALRL
eukprot:13854737-Alexandrium_andersonii.AAC.1